MKEISKRTALAGMLTALAMVFSYIEVLLPFSIGIWGIKLGLANLVVLSGLYFLPHRDVFIVSMTRIFLTTLLFGNIMALAYSLAGGVFSFLVMSWLQKRRLLSMAGVSIAGGICHNIGQIMAAYLILQSEGVFLYLPVLMISGIAAGMIIGVTAGKILPVFKGRIGLQQ
jgi:heptaprenyl diphosphate synthase